jgi:hypothetical protein
MAGDQGRLELMDEIYAIVAPLMPSADVDDLTRLETEMIYQCDRGDVGEASRQALRFAAVARATGDSLTLLRAARNASVPLRLNGQYGEARTLLLEAVNAAVSRRSYVLARHITLDLVRVYLVEGNVSAAREEMNRFAEFNFTTDDSQSNTEFVYLNARLCLDEGKLEEADSCCAELLPKADTLATNRRAAILAVGVRLLTALGKDKQRRLQMLSELERLHLRYRDIGFQDYEAYSLYLGLSGIGEEQRATELLCEYANVHRRDRSPLPASIMAIAGPQRRRRKKLTRP